MQGRWSSVYTGVLSLALVTLLFQNVESSYELRIRAHRYSNGGHKLSDGTCCDKSGRSNCDPWWCAHCECDNRFKFCLRRHGASRDSNENNCPLGWYRTGEIGDDGFSFGSSQIAGGVSNPMTFSGDIWGGGFQLLVSVYDEDNVNSDDHVDDVYAEHNLNPGGSITEQEYTGQSGNSRIGFSFELACNLNFYGQDCATYCVGRNDNEGHYYCHHLTGAKTCRSGWSDPHNNCLTPVCSRNCHARGGYCNRPGQCLCLSGWSGSGCRQCQPASGCSEVGGYCNIPGECICSEGYSGANCEVDLIPCQRGSPCSQGVICSNDGVGGYICHCPVGYTGPACEEEIDECDPNPCHNGSTCIDQVGGFICECPDGFVGEFCHINVDECLSDPCQNSAQCVDLPNGFVCLCTGGYEGPLCDQDHDDCTPYPCENGGTCHDLLGGYQCNCTAGWAGDRCQIDINDCVPSPCQNGGTCYDKVNGYECVCLRGWDGDECELEIDECTPSPCDNGAACTDLIGSFNCSCSDGYYGDRCQFEANECLSNPCLNAGACSDLINSYSCTCTDGFTGVNCEVNLFPCRHSPCQNGGTCVEEYDDYSCLCPSGYTDNDCLFPFDPQVESLASDSQGDDVMEYVTWVVPVAVLLILILIVAMVIITVYWHRRKNKRMILAPPDVPMGNGFGVKDLDFIVADNPVYAVNIPPCPEPHVYATLDTYAVPTNGPLETTPTKTVPADYCHPTSFENPYSNIDDC